MVHIWRRREHVRENWGKKSSTKVAEYGFSPYLAQAADAHVQGFSVAPGPIQNLRCQFYNQSCPSGLALQRARVVRIIRDRKPLIKLPLVLDIIVCRALLSTKITCFWRAVLQKRRRKRSVSLLVMNDHRVV